MTLCDVGKLLNLSARQPSVVGGGVRLGLVTVGDKRDLISAQISAFIVAAERWDMFAEQHQADM